MVNRGVRGAVVEGCYPSLVVFFRQLAPFMINPCLISLSISKCLF